MDTFKSALDFIFTTVLGQIITVMVGVLFAQSVQVLWKNGDMAMNVTIMKVMISLC